MIGGGSAIGVVVVVAAARVPLEGESASDQVDFDVDVVAGIINLRLGQCVAGQFHLRWEKWKSEDIFLGK